MRRAHVTTNRAVSLRNVLFACVAALVFLAAASAGGANERVAVDAATKEISALASKALEDGAVGLSIAVSYGDEIIFDQGVGMAEVEHDVASDAETIYRIGSITKQFTSALVMRQVEAGKIGLDDPISKYVDFPTGDHVVTVRHLLTHTSGIKSYTGLGEVWLKTVPLELSHEELLDLVEEQPFDFSPGEDYLYNNTGYYLLGMILEKVTSSTYPELILEQVAQPLELARTRYGSNADIIKNRAQGYSVVEGELKNDALIGMSQPGAAGALLSTAGDLLRWQRVLTNGKFVSRDSYEQMTTPHVLESGKDTGYGFGLGIGEMNGLKEVQHGGGIPGFNSMLTYFPETGVGVAVISNSEGYSAGRLAKEIARAVHGIEIEVSDLAVGEAEQARLSGTYTFERIAADVTVRGEGEQLFLKVTGQSENRILYQGDGEFRAGFDPDVRIEFKPGTPSPGLILYQGGQEIEANRKE